MLDVLLRRMPLKEFLRERDVKYIVTSSAPDAMPATERSLLSELSRHDRQSMTGDTVEIDGMLFCKMLSSSQWTGRHIAAIRPQASESWPGDAGGQSQRHGPLWNSVYAVLGPAALVPAYGVATGLGFDPDGADSGAVVPGDSIRSEPAGAPVDSVAALADVPARKG